MANLHTATLAFLTRAYALRNQDMTVNRRSSLGVSPTDVDFEPCTFAVRLVRFEQDSKLAQEYYRPY